MRKTVDISFIKEKANFYLRTSGNDCIKERIQLASFVSTLFHEAKNYKGFGYLTENNVAKGLTWGITFGENGGPNEYKDESRVFFF